MSTYRAQAEAVEAAYRVLNGSRKPRPSELVIILENLNLAADTLRKAAAKEAERKRVTAKSCGPVFGYGVA
jgi:hypothetical protein